MALIVVILGAVLIVAAIRNSHRTLFAALGQDVPGYVVWAAAILAIGIIGWIPGLTPLSRGLLALVIVVIVLNNYQSILNGFESAWTQPGGTSSNTSNSSQSSSDPLASFENFMKGLPSAIPEGLNFSDTMAGF